MINYTHPMRSGSQARRHKGPNHRFFLAALLLVGGAGCAGATDQSREDVWPPTETAYEAGPNLLALKVDRAIGSGLAGGPACIIDTVSSQALRVDGVPVYVNGQALSVSSHQVLLAGYPNYIFRPGAEPVTDSIFGLVIDGDGAVTVVPAPMQGHLGDPVAIPRPEGGWHIAFAELAQSYHETPVPSILGLWSGVFDGGEWSNLERLPVPRNYRLDHPEGTSLLRHGDTLALATIANPLGQILLFERVDGRWSWERVTLAGDNREFPEPATVQTLALIPWQNRYALVAHKNDATIDTIYESLFLYARDSGWQERKVVDGIDPYVTSQSTISASPTIDVVSWVHQGVVVAYVGSLEAGNLRAFTVDATTGVPRTDPSMTSRLTRLPDDTPLWVTQTKLHDDSGEIRLLAATEDSVTPIGTISYPSWRLQASAAAPDHVVIATIEIELDREESPFSSFLLRIRTQCERPSH